MTSDDLREARRFASEGVRADAFRRHYCQSPCNQYPTRAAWLAELDILVDTALLVGKLVDEIDRLQSQLGPPPRTDREAFVRANAISVVADLERKVDRQRAELAKLNRRRHTHVAERRMLIARAGSLQQAVDALDALLAVICEVHAQYADDLCWMDIDRIFAAAGLAVPDRRVGDKAVMLTNCARFIDVLCAGGKWPTYVELEQERDALKKLVSHCLVYSGSMDCGFWHMTPEQQALYKRLRTEYRL